MRIFFTLCILMTSLVLAWSQCEIELILVSDPFCDDNSTSTDPSDDVFYAEVSINGINVSNSWITEDEGISNGSYGMTYIVGPYPIANGDHLLIIRDTTIVDCVDSLLLIAPAACSDACELHPTISTTINDNGTPTLCGDDTFMVDVLVQATGIGFLDGWRIVLGNGNFAEGGLYDEIVSLGPYPVYDDLGGFANFDLKIADNLNIGCYSIINIEAPQPENCQCELIDFDFTIGAYNNNGTPNNCTDDIVEIIVSPPTFMGETSGMVQVLIDGNQLYTGFPTTLTLAVPADNNTHILTIIDDGDLSCAKSKVIPAQGQESPSIDGCPDITLNCITPSAVLDCGVEDTSGLVYEWVDISGSTISTSETLDVFTAGAYTLEVTNDADCSTLWTVEVTEDISPPPVEIYQTGDLCDEGNGVTLATVNTGLDIAFQWSTGETTAAISVFEAGLYSITMTNVSNGCAGVDSIEISPSSIECNLLEGFVFDTENCLVDGTETPLSNWMIEIQGDDYLEYRNSDNDGYYSIYLPLGTFTVSLIPLSPAWEICINEQSVVFENTNETRELNLLTKAIDDCPLLEVDIDITSNLRPCWDDRSIFVSYTNVGTDTLFDGVIAIVLPEELTYSHSDSNDFLSQEGDTLFFATANAFAPGAMQQFRVYVDVDCDTQVGIALCVRALGLPYEPCPEADGLWSGASLEVRGECTDEAVIFHIQNIGNNTMSELGNFLVVQDGVMLKEEPEHFPPLGEGQEIALTYPANGITYRLELMQEGNHPGFSKPVAVVEGCGTNEAGSFSTGFVLQFPPDDDNYYIDEDCSVVTNSFDPNDKQAEPLGYSESHYIETDQELEYKIRFQNTGTDTAFTVIIRDTLSEWLDMRSLHAGVSSHPYRLQLDSARAISFVFDNILLPDSTTNWEGSQGFIEFKISPVPDAPLETLVENTAAIYFDFNDAVITNTTHHTLGRNFIQILTWVQTLDDSRQWKIFPNPIDEHLNITREGSTDDAIFILYDALGRVEKQFSLSSAESSFDVSDLVTGWYSFQLMSIKGMLIGSGTLVKK